MWHSTLIVLRPRNFKKKCLVSLFVLNESFLGRTQAFHIQVPSRPCFVTCHDVQLADTPLTAIQKTLWGDDDTRRYGCQSAVSRSAALFCWDHPESRRPKANDLVRKLWPADILNPLPPVLRAAFSTSTIVVGIISPDVVCLRMFGC